MVWLGRHHDSSPAKKAMVFALFRRQQGSHSKLKEEKISLVQKLSRESTDSDRPHHESMFKIQPDIFEDISEGRDEEWTADFKNHQTRRDSNDMESRNDSAIALLPTSPKKANAVFSGTPISSSTLADNKDAIIESLKQKCKALRDKVLQYGDVDNYSESEVAMALEREKYRLKKELKVVKSQLKFTNTALEDAVQKLQDQSLEKASLAETIDNQSDEIHDFKLKCELLEKEVRELKRQLLKLEEETSSADKDGRSSKETVVEIVMSSSSSNSENSGSTSTGAAASNGDRSKTSGNRDLKQDTSNPFDDESTASSSTYRNPFDDDLSSHSRSRSQRNPFSNNENVNTDNTKHLSVEEALQRQVAELQAKYAQKMAAQLSRIAALEEENEIKDIQIKNLKERLEHQQIEGSGHMRRLGNWMRNDGKSSNEEPSAQVVS
jgi:hypothetical protein